MELMQRAFPGHQGNVKITSRQDTNDLECFGN